MSDRRSVLQSELTAALGISFHLQTAQYIATESPAYFWHLSEHYQCYSASLETPKYRMEIATTTKLYRRKNVNSRCCTVLDGIRPCCSRENQRVCSREVTSLQQEQELMAEAPSQSCKENCSWVGTKSSRAGPGAGGRTAKVGNHTDKATLRGGGGHKS